MLEDSITIQKIFAAFGALCVVLVPLMCALGITRIRQYREIIRCLKRELARAEGVDSWEDGPDSERPAPAAPEPTAHLAPESAIQAALNAAERRNAAQVAELTPMHQARVACATAIVNYGRAWLEENKVPGAFAMRECLGGNPARSHVSVIYRNETGNSTHEHHIVAPGKGYEDMMRGIAEMLLNAREFARESPLRRLK